MSGDLTVPRNIVTRAIAPRANYILREVQTLDPIVSTNVGPTFGALNFQFSDLANYTNWQALFDRYRLKSVKVTFNQIGVQMQTDTMTAGVPKFATVIDFDDSTVPTSFAQLDRYSTYGSVMGTSGLVRHFLPRAARPVYNGLAPSAYQESEPNCWNDMAYPSIPHYGLKYGLDTCSTTIGYITYLPMVEYVFELSGQRG